MAKIQLNFSIILSIVLFVFSVKCDRFDEFKRNLFSIRNLDILSGIDGILSAKWTQNQQCAAELSAIENGLKNFEEWAFKSESMGSNYLKNANKNFRKLIPRMNGDFSVFSCGCMG